MGQARLLCRSALDTVDHLHLLVSYWRFIASPELLSGRGGKHCSSMSGKKRYVSTTAAGGTGITLIFILVHPLMKIMLTETINVRMIFYV